MKKLIITALAIGLGMHAVAAQAGPADKPDSQSLSQGAKDANPSVTGGGSTADPTAEPKSGTISDTAKENTDSGYVGNNEGWEVARKLSALLWKYFEPKHPYSPPQGQFRKP